MVVLPVFLRKMNTHEIETIEQPRVAVDHDPRVIRDRNLFQVIGDLTVGLPRLSKVNGGR